MLRVEGLNAWYGVSHILQGVDIRVAPGEIVVLMGRNGAGKTTTLRSIMGLGVRTTGSVIWKGLDLLDKPARCRYGMSIGFVPEDRRIVPGLTVQQNLELGALALADRREADRRIKEVFSMFPRLGERVSQVGVTMSGGEQQMLAIGRALVGGPEILLLDEPSEGIMPLLVNEMMHQLVTLKRRGLGILLVEQNVELALRISDRAYIMEQGRIVHHAASDVLLNDREIQERYCAV